MRRDYIVEEVRRNREAIAREYGNDLRAIVTAFQREDATSGVATVSLPPRRVVKPASPRKPSLLVRQTNKAVQSTGRAQRNAKPGKRRRAARG